MFEIFSSSSCCSSNKYACLRSSRDFKRSSPLFMASWRVFLADCTLWDCEVFLRDDHIFLGSTVAAALTHASERRL